MSNELQYSEVGALVAATVAEERRKGIYEGVRIVLFLDEPQSRWELLALAMLLAARVTEEVAETTLLALRERGLLDYQQLVSTGAASVGAVLEVLEAEYRAPVSRRLKAEALVANARLLADNWAGDLNNIYLQQQAEPASSYVVRALQGFQQINTRARWICRCMYEASLWPDISLKDRAYIDLHARRALERLGILKPGPSWAETKQSMEAVIEASFAGDPASLSKLGRFFCLPSSSVICENQCRALPLCAYRKSRPIRSRSGVK